MKEQITDEEYETVQHQLKLFAQLIIDLNISGCIDRQSTADAVAPLFNPSLYMAAQGRFRVVKRLTFAALKFQREVVACNEELEKLGPPATPEQIDAFRKIGELLGS